MEVNLLWHLVHPVIIVIHCFEEVSFKCAGIFYEMNINIVIFNLPINIWFVIFEPKKNIKIVERNQNIILCDWF